MKIDAVLARHPWPWEIIKAPRSGYWVVRSVSIEDETVFDCDGMDEETRDAILELVAAHVVAKAQGEASEEEKKL